MYVFTKVWSYDWFYHLILISTPTLIEHNCKQALSATCHSYGGNTLAVLIGNKMSLHLASRIVQW